MMSSRSSGRVRLTAEQAREAREAAAAAVEARSQAIINARTIQNRKAGAARAEATGMPSVGVAPVDAAFRPKGWRAASSNEPRDDDSSRSAARTKKRLAAVAQEEIPMDQIPISVMVTYEPGGDAAAVGDEGAVPKKMLKLKDQRAQVRTAHLPSCLPASRPPSRARIGMREHPA